MLELPSDLAPVPLGGPARRVLWAATGRDPREHSALQAARRLNAFGAAPHLVWHPLTGEIVRLLPPGTRNQAFRPDDLRSELFMVGVVATADAPFTGYPADWAALRAAVEEAQAPPEWPLGPPTGFATERGFPVAWGHYSACQLTSRWGAVGRIDADLLTGQRV